MSLDAMLIEHIQPALVSAYLSANGWQVAETRADRSIRWTHPAYESAELILPPDSIRPEIADQKRALVAALASIEARPAQDVLMTLVHIGADRLRVNVQRPETSRGTLAIDNAVRLSQGLNKLLTTIAWATLSPGPFLSGKKPTQVSKYARSLEISPVQAESGYSVQVLSPLVELDQDSFSRQTLLALVTTLEDVRLALDGHTFSPEQMGTLIEHFVTADLCEALVLVLGKPTKGKRSRGEAMAAREIRFNFEWSPALAAPTEMPDEVIFQSELSERLQTLAEQLRETPPQEDFQIKGRITELKRSEQTGIGKVVLTTESQDALGKISMELEPEQYDLAIQAHLDESSVLCSGTLIKDKRTYSLINPTLFPSDGQDLSNNEKSDLLEEATR